MLPWQRNNAISLGIHILSLFCDISFFNRDSKRLNWTILVFLRHEWQLREFTISKLLGIHSSVLVLKEVGCWIMCMLFIL